MQTGCITLICRKRAREVEISNLRRDAAKNRWSKRHARVLQPSDANRLQQSDAKPASASASASTPIGEGVRGGGNIERPSIREVQAHAAKIGLAPWKAEDWFYEMEGCGWKDYSNRDVNNWQAVLNRVRTKWEADGRPSGPPSSQKGKTRGQSRGLI